MPDTQRCPACFGKGKVSSTAAALRSVIGRLTPRDFKGDGKLFDRAKALYADLTRKSPSTETTKRSK